MSAGVAPAAGLRRRRVAGLVLSVQRQLETLYALDAQPAVTDFLIDEIAAGRLHAGDGSRTLITQNGDDVSLAVVLAHDVTEHLARDDPRCRLHGRNLGPFCTLIEEVSHFVFLLFCAQTGRSVSQLELELQAEVDKYLSAANLLLLQNEGAMSAGLKELLFREYHLADGVSAERAERYHAASGLAYRYCGFLEAEYLRRARLDDLRREARRFYRLGQAGKLERISAARRT